MNAQEIMTPAVEQIRPDSNLMEASMLMSNHDVGCLAVADNGDVVGVITDRDIVVRAIAVGRDPKTTNAGDVMSENPVFCNTDDSIETIAARMEEYKIRRLIVLDADRTPVGVVTLGDLAARGHELQLSGEVEQEICGCQ